MDTLRHIVTWYAQHKNYVDFIKDIIFTIGVVATFYGYFKFLRFLTQRRLLNKRQEMENDSRLYAEIYDKLKEYVESYAATPKNLRDIGIRLLHMKNYPYNLDNDGFRFMLQYYFLTEHHKPSGYISGKGLYIVDYIHYFSQSIYFNQKNGKWFVDDEKQVFKKYQELSQEQLSKRIPFANILGSDFNSDWSDKGEPVFYTKYKYTDWRLFADDFEAITIKDGEYPLDRLTLQKNKRVRPLRTRVRGLKRKIRVYFKNKEVNKLAKKRKNKQ